MSILRDVIVEFAREIGSGEPDLEDGKPVVFRFEKSGRLFIEGADREGSETRRVIVYLEFPNPVERDEQMMAILGACDPRHDREIGLRAGLTGADRPVLAASILEADLTLQTLNAIIGELLREQARLAS